MPPEIRRVTEAFLHNPQKVEVSKPATAAVTVAQSQVPAGREAHEKREVLRRLLRDAKDLKNAIIFCNRKREVAVLHKSLQKHGFSAGALHGDMDQPARMAALEQFRKGELPLLVASDVAARGLDIPEVSHVFNFDVPHHPDEYVHRIGRTGRAGRSGTAISIVTPIDSKSIAAIEKLIGQSIPRAEGDYSARSEDREESGERREHRSREGSRRGRGKPQREREPRHHGQHRNGSSQQSATPRGAPASRNQPRRISREAESEPADHSHLPAFLLRPVRDRV
jgi:superfamily II DNA/RNA helicase